MKEQHVFQFIHLHCNMRCNINVKSITMVVTNGDCNVKIDCARISMSMIGNWLFDTFCLNTVIKYNFSVDYNHCVSIVYIVSINFFDTCTSDLCNRRQSIFIFRDSSYIRTTSQTSNRKRRCRRG